MKLSQCDSRYAGKICRSITSAWSRRGAQANFCATLALLCLVATTIAGETNVLVVPESSLSLRVAVDLPSGIPGETAHSQIVEVDDGAATVPVQFVPRLTADGSVADERGCLMAVIPGKEHTSGDRRFKLQDVTGPKESETSPFEFATIDDRSLKISDDGKPVLSYNYDTIIGEHVPENDNRRRRACYIHPVWGLDGEKLTDDFPRDHFHHHGVFWAWPHVNVGGGQYDLWVNRGIEQRFVRWLHRQVGPVAAVFGVENGWFVGDRQVMTERVWVRVFAAGDGERSVDIDLFFVPKEEISLQGAGGKSYGGLVVRYAVRKGDDVKITVPDGPTTEDLKETPLAWADLTTQFEGAADRSGGAVFVHPEHPDFPPTWLTRHYGPLCVGWPGVNAHKFVPGKPFHIAYRLWLHRGAGEHEGLKAKYGAYTSSAKVTWCSPPTAEKTE